MLSMDQVVVHTFSSQEFSRGSGSIHPHVLTIGYLPNKSLVPLCLVCIVIERANLRVNGTVDMPVFAFVRGNELGNWSCFRMA